MNLKSFEFALEEDQRLKVALQDMGIESLFPVQMAVWQETVEPGAFNGDLCINLPTGSGKTLAYALPIVQTLATLAQRCLCALVVMPTRDLAVQAKQVFDSIAPTCGLRVGLAIGQSSISDEISEHIKRPKFELSSLYDTHDVHEELKKFRRYTCSNTLKVDGSY